MTYRSPCIVIVEQRGFNSWMNLLVEMAVENFFFFRLNFFSLAFQLKEKEDDGIQEASHQKMVNFEVPANLRNW